MKFDANSAVYKAICGFAQQHYPNEACGFIVKKGKRSVVIDCENRSPNPLERFEIDQLDWANAADEGEVIASWHSHTNGINTPSASDIAGMEVCGLPYVIVGICDPEDNGQFCFSPASVTTPTGDVMAYTGRPYVFGLLDCYTLAVDYYRKEFGIVLDRMEHTRIEDFWEKGHNFFEEGFKKVGFEQMLNGEPAKVGDAFLLQVGSNFSNHVAIYIGDDKILHHCTGRLSTTDIYGGGFWQKHTAFHLRHKSLC